MKQSRKSSCQACKKQWCDHIYRQWYHRQVGKFCTPLQYWAFCKKNSTMFIFIRCISVCRDSGNRRRQKDYVPTMWNEHFDEKQDINLGEGQQFRVYFSKRDKENQKPLLLLLHGGGYSGLTWAHFTVNYFPIFASKIPTKCKIISIHRPK